MWGLCGGGTAPMGPHNPHSPHNSETGTRGSDTIRSTPLKLCRARVTSKEASVQHTKPDTTTTHQPACPCVPQVATHTQSSSADSRRATLASCRQGLRQHCGKYVQLGQLVLTHVVNELKQLHPVCVWDEMSVRSSSTSGRPCGRPSSVDHRAFFIETHTISALRSRFVA